jgi:hypothetical protein
MFAWLDYSERERQKMLSVVDAFREHDTRDELGVGSVRDAFADMLFPGTSTIMTRARYFLLVPWTYLRLEKQRVDSEHIATRARRAETDLIEVIENSDDNEGNIGKIAKTTLKRLPSSVYWQGLGLWQIRTFQGAQAQYHRGLDGYYPTIARQARRAAERDIEHDDLVTTNWHGGLVEVPSDFPAQCSLRLKKVEAEYLAERIRLSAWTAGSLLAELAARKCQTDDVPFVWQHPLAAELPEKLREQLLHAGNFSEVMHGAPLLYNLILAEESQRDERISTYRERFGEWSQGISARLPGLRDWKRTRFWEIVRSANPRVSAATYEFINAWWDLALNGDAAGLRDRASVRMLIAERERRLKKNLARIGNPNTPRLWNGDSGSAQLEFRWQIGQRLLRDIFDGLEAPDA